MWLFCFVDKRKKIKITGEFAEIFANVCKEKIDDSFHCVVCGTGKYRVEKAKKDAMFANHFPRGRCNTT